MGTSDKYTEEVNSHLLNPFVHRLELDNAYDKIKTAVFTVILMPFRVVVICVLLISAWMLACLGLYGLTEEELRKKPMLGWRRALKSVICLIGRWSYLAGGMAITVKGKRAHRSQAPILVVAPHSSFLDSVIVYVTHMASIIVRRESNDNHYVGKLINYTQPVYVWRDDPNSRHNTIKEIIERATSSLDWPQVLIFPEGTCTNRSCLITFKPGAFYPGVPIQPVCIRYPNKLDTVTWTWEGPGALKILWLTLTQIHSHCEIEFLPVYYPSEAEKSDPKLYAANVRNVMARALNVPVSDYTYDDCKLMNRAKKLNLPHVAAIVEFEKLRRCLGNQNLRAANIRRAVDNLQRFQRIIFQPRAKNLLICRSLILRLHKTNIEETIISNAGGIGVEDNFMVTLNEMASRLRVSPDDPALQKIFSIYDQHNVGSIDMRDYLLCALFIIKPSIRPLEFIRNAFKMYDRSGFGQLNVKDFYHVAKKTLAWSYEDCISVFQQIDTKNKKFITFDQFMAYSATKQELKYMHRVYETCEHEKSH